MVLSEQISKEEYMMMYGIGKQRMMGPGTTMGPPGGMMTMGGYPG
jgi:hypothetical protein